MAGWFAISLFASRHGPRMSTGITKSTIHQVDNSSIEVHSVTPQAVVHQAALPVMFLVSENPRVGGTVRAGFPIGILLLMTRPAPLDESGTIRSSNTRLLRNVALPMSRQSLSVVADVVIMAGAAIHAAMSRRAPVLHERTDLMTARAELRSGERWHRSREQNPERRNSHLGLRFFTM
jgi:hypothetical protein